MSRLSRVIRRLTRPALFQECPDAGRLLLRHKTLGLFYVGSNQWTYELESAQQFRSVAAALKAAASESGAPLEIVKVSENEGIEIISQLNTELNTEH